MYTQYLCIWDLIGIPQNMSDATGFLISDVTPSLQKSALRLVEVSKARAGLHEYVSFKAVILNVRGAHSSSFGCGSEIQGRPEV